MERRSIVVVVLLIASLAIIAFLQYRSVAEASRAQREALRASLDESTRRFSDDFEREIGRAFNCFQRPPEDGWGCWSDNALDPKIVRALYVFEGGGIKRFNPDSALLFEVNWPDAVEAERQRVRGPVEPRQLFMLGDDVVMFVPQPPSVRDNNPPPPGQDNGEPPPPERRRRPRGQQLGMVQFDADVIFTRFIPKLRENDLRNVDVAIFRPNDHAHPLFHTADVSRFAKPDIVHPLIRSPQATREVAAPIWEVAVVHRAGSLDAAVAGVRTRNLVMSGAVLLLLITSIVVLVVTTRRAQSLARQQLDFVAGISHELNTPLAAIRSAAENLADGVVHDDEQLRNYGTMIVREGRRLSGMVGKVLTYAGVESGTRWRREPVDVKQLVERVAHECRWMTDERGGAIGVDVDGVGPVLGDVEALRRALQNVVENAVKYGGRPPRVDIRATEGKRKVVISIEDNGSGIDETDLPHVFDPFYRGHHVVARAVPGSGLGLSLVRRIVESHGGRTSVSNRTGGGAVVTIEIPSSA
ncbi:MAG TPA: HAMP domain-containing sensor histidine kinase [Thermoanaerobaculia bacterium]|nr:HAMP domain-containing sensor histidine kinase [Thermoanaerobaculia bacterium]